MNGYHPNNGASTSSHNYDDYPASHSNQPVFNNNHPHHHQRQQQLQSIQQRPPQNQWSQGMQMNGQQPVPPQHQPPFNQSPWGNQISPLSSFPNNMNVMSGFNMNFIPQQVIQEAYALSVAVSASDEPTLVSRLLSSRKRGESYKEALNSLHAVGGHSASLWKDYYLDHKDRIDAWITMCLQKDNDKSSPRDDLSKSASSLIGTAKKPSFKQESPPSVSTRVSISAPPVKPSKKTNHSMPPLPIEQPLISRRSTINSITAPAPVFGSRLPAPNAEIKIPEPPSRSPSPPTNIIPHRGRGNKYTQEDRDFFINFVGWRLKQDPSLTRHDICDLLAEKAPHHSAQSWASHWSNNHDLPDKILAAARGIEQEAEGSDSEEEDGPANPRPNYKDDTTSEESGEESGSEEEKESEDDESDNKLLRRWTEDDMGEKGGPFTDADNYMAARYLASFPDFEGATSRERWAPFHDKHPRRSVKSWVEYYRRNGRVIEKLAKRIQREENNFVPSIYTQCARPTLTQKDKRKHIESDDDHDTDDVRVNNGRPKRGRPDAG